MLRAYKLHILLRLIGIALLAILPFGACCRHGPETTIPTGTNIQATNITSSSAQISWNSELAGTTQVEYGTTADYGSVTDEVTTLTTSHVVMLSGLSAETIYHYRVKTRVPEEDMLLVSTDRVFITEAPP